MQIIEKDSIGQSSANRSSYRTSQRERRVLPELIRENGDSEHETTKDEDEDDGSDDVVEVPRNIGLFGGIAFVVGCIIGIN